MASEWQTTTRGEKSIHQKASRYSEDLGGDLDALVILNKQQRKARIKERRVAVQSMELILPSKRTNGRKMADVC